MAIYYHLNVNVLLVKTSFIAQVVKVYLNRNKYYLNDTDATKSKHFDLRRDLSLLITSGFNFQHGGA